jgi:hypothetical protein
MAGAFSWFACEGKTHVDVLHQAFPLPDEWIGSFLIGIAAVLYVIVTWTLVGVPVRRARKRATNP